MTQKILKVGSSAAVTIPKHAMKKLGISIGDKVRVEINEKRGTVKIKPVIDRVDHELVEWTQKYIEKYKPALKALSKK